jgi:4-hydroxybenzoate polyprenyltransferase/phosphoserine phosphatase
MSTHADVNPNTRPLVVDLDGTLIKTDLLLESVSYFIRTNLLRCVYVFYWLLQGMPYLKARCARSTSWLDPASLPYNTQLVSWLQQQKACGRTLVLATGSYHLLATPVAEHLDLFSEVMATNDVINLTSKNKRDALLERFGVTGFDYIGNSRADIPVWKASTVSYVVSSSSRFVKHVHKIGNLGTVFSAQRPSIMRSILKAMRPYQWVKNLLLFMPLMTAYSWSSPVVSSASSMPQVCVAFVVFCLTASSVYVLNDLVDVLDDRHHHRKRHRPFASGHLNLLVGWALWPSLLMLAGLIAVFMLPGRFCAVLVSYFVLTFAYSQWLKQKAIVDVLTLAALYTLRLIAGAAAAGVPLSFWLLAFSMFFFLSLAFIKRFSELRTALKTGQEGALRGRGYVASEDLEIVSSMGVAAGYLAVLVFALYIQDSHTALLYREPRLMWLTCPMLLGWISRTWLIAHRGKMHDDPIVFAMKDHVSWLIAACFMSVFYLAKVLG